MMKTNTLTWFNLLGLLLFLVMAALLVIVLMHAYLGLIASVGWHDVASVGWVS